MTSPGPARPADRPATRRNEARFRRVEVVANVASGGVDQAAPAEIEKIFGDFGVAAHVCAPSTDDLTSCLRAAIDSSPDLLAVLAGDGTIRAAAELCGADGPVLAPLPGGTMNLLPRAVYGARSWQDALRAALAQGEAVKLGGGEVEGRLFLCSALLGAPALWQPAREAARYGELRLTWLRARKAIRRAFTGRLRYALDGGPRRKAGAVCFICPAVSRALPAQAPALEAAAFDPEGAGDVVGLGLHALLGDWRNAKAVGEATPCEVARVWGSVGIPAIIDGESVRLRSAAEVRFRPDAVKVLALREDLTG
jgi:diacylglycerol kinase family enzyme